MLRFATALEKEYQGARFGEYRQYAIAMGCAAVALCLGLWLRDFANDPLGARHTVGIRIVMAAGVATYVLALWLPVRRGLKLATGYLAIVVIEFSVLAIWGRLATGYSGGFAGYLYIYLLTPLVLLPFSYRESVGALLLVGIVPNLQVLAGMAPGFPTASFNALVWPAFVVTAFAQRQFDRLFRRLFVSQRELAGLARQDPLTGLGNRRDFMERAAVMHAAARRYGRELCVLMIDIDHFKRVNDSHGHAAGDDVLRHLAVVLSLQLRGTDLCGRIGGEEFVVLLVETGADGGLQVAERIRAATAAAAVPSEHAPHALHITISVGVAALPDSADTLEELLRQADGALYRAKADGRNCVRLASHRESPAVLTCPSSCSNTATAESP